MDAVLIRRFHPEEYCRKFLDDGLRPDGRVPRERRAARLEKSVMAAPHGSASVRLGQSTALCGVRAEVVEATPDQAALGRISVTVEFPALCAPSFRDRTYRAQGQATFLSEALTSLFNTAAVFDPSQLDVREGDVAWVLQANVVCMNFDGNAFDMCVLAVLAALEDTKLPALQEQAPLVDGKPGRMVVVSQGAASPAGSKSVFEGQRVAFVSRPVPVTFAQLPGADEQSKDQWVVDPCAAEEGLGATTSLCLVGGKWLVYHQGGAAASQCFLDDLMPIARSMLPAVEKLLDSGAPAGDGYGAADVSMGTE